MTQDGKSRSQGGGGAPLKPVPADRETSDAPASRRPVTVPWVRRKGRRREPLVMVTAYDYPQARSADAAGVDVVLVGDSLAMVVLGHPDTLSLTLDEMLHHVRAVRRGTERPLLVADMPYGSFHLSPEQATSNALRLVKEGGAQAVKIEGARPQIVAALTRAEIPVMAHLGLTPQSLHRFGGYRVQGKSKAARRALLEAAEALEAEGAFALVLECVPADLAAEVSERLEIPTIGIGAGVGCDGQVLVYHDLLGLEDRLAPRFVRRYAELGAAGASALRAFADDVRQRRFPGPEETFLGPSETAAAAEGRLYG
ncbi:MAG: 3-methyl-2-oxobutanoate hydroxymethyltransferase [Acidobacteriota bacterium]